MFGDKLDGKLGARSTGTLLPSREERPADARDRPAGGRRRAEDQPADDRRAADEYWPAGDYWSASDLAGRRMGRPV